MENLYKLLEDKVVNCRTRKDAKVFLRLLANNGYTWFSGDSLKTFTNWDDMGINTCYSITKNMCVHYGNIEYYKKNERKVITFQQFKKIINNINIGGVKNEMQALSNAFCKFKDSISKQEVYDDSSLLYLKIQSAYLQGWNDCKKFKEENKEE